MAQKNNKKQTERDAWAHAFVLITFGTFGPQKCWQLKKTGHKSQID